VSTLNKLLMAVRRTVVCCAELQGTEFRSSYLKQADGSSRGQSGRAQQGQSANAPFAVDGDALAGSDPSFEEAAAKEEEEFPSSLLLQAKSYHIEPAQPLCIDLKPFPWLQRRSIAPDLGCGGAGEVGESTESTTRYEQNCEAQPGKRCDS
jgi:hypothetical protein